MNQDDLLSSRFSAATAGHRVWYGKTRIQIAEKEFKISDVELEEDGIRFNAGDLEISSPLRGEFNFYNLLAATSTALALHIDKEAIQKALSRVGNIPGRMEFVQKNPFAVVVDYAHTPDSLIAVYKTLSNPSRGKLICVLGSAGGGRDKWKRKEFGRIAGQYCDEIFLANEDPYNEDPKTILNDVASGIPQEKKYNLILDRREAIFKALQSAKTNDTVIITGKGAEPWIMGPNQTKIAWDDREVAREELQKIN